MILLCDLMYDFFCYKQKTAYVMRISDWSSDVCSSDLTPRCGTRPPARTADRRMRQRPPRRPPHACAGSTGPCPCPRQMYCRDTRSEHPCSLPCCADVLTLSIHEPSALRQRYVGY